VIGRDHRLSIGKISCRRQRRRARGGGGGSIIIVVHREDIVATDEEHLCTAGRLLVLDVLVPKEVDHRAKA